MSIFEKIFHDLESKHAQNNRLRRPTKLPGLELTSTATTASLLPVPGLPSIAIFSASAFSAKLQCRLRAARHDQMIYRGSSDRAAWRRTYGRKYCSQSS
jgi:hypothetical protein